jgi:hypothetical protein
MLAENYLIQLDGNVPGYIVVNDEIDPFLTRQRAQHIFDVGAFKIKAD